MAVEDFKKWAAIEEISWRQNSRELWLKEEDTNTNFFHTMVNARRRINFVAKLRVDDESLIEEDNIKDGVANAFSMILVELGNGG